MRYYFFYVVAIAGPGKSVRLSERTIPFRHASSDAEAIEQVRKFAKEEAVMCSALGCEFGPGSLVCVNRGKIRKIQLV